MGRGSNSMGSSSMGASSMGTSGLGSAMGGSKKLQPIWALPVKIVLRVGILLSHLSFLYILCVFLV